MSAVPEDPYVVEIVSATYGDQDVTAYVNTQFATYQSSNPKTRSWTYTAGNDWYKNDPLPNYWKTTCLVWRNTIPLPNGDVVWSNFKRTAATEGSTITITFDGVGDTAWSPPGVPANGRYIISAFWFNKDCTSIAQNICNTQSYDPGHFHGLSFDVSVTTLGPDPWTATGKKQFSVTYASPGTEGDWIKRCQVASGPNSGWSLELPQLFPPVVRPNVADHQTYITFRNRDTFGASIYPMIWNSNRSIAWDGKAAKFMIPTSEAQSAISFQWLTASDSAKDVDLFGRAGLTEGSYYYCGFVSVDGMQTYGDSTSMIIATSSAMGRPASVYIGKVYGTLPACGYDYVQINKPISYQPRDLRLDIYSVTFGSTDYTDFVRQKYISQVIQNPPSDTVNSWSFRPTSDEAGKPSFFGPDPFGGRQKSCVVIYKVAYQIGQTDGFISGPNDPQPWDDAYKTLAPLHTNQYPVLRDITAFRIAAAHNGDVMTFNLLTENLSQTLTLPSPCPNPYVAAAVWATRDVTAYVTNTVRNTAANSDVIVPVGTLGMGAGFTPADPWFGINKQCTILVGYPSSPGIGTTLRWVTLLSWGGADPWTITIPRAMPTLPGNLGPANYISDDRTKPVITAINLTNMGSVPAWPQVVSEAGQVIWDGRNKNNDFFRIPAGQSRSISLISDAQCVEGASYGVNFYYSQYTFPPFCGWMIASSNDKWKINLTYMRAPTKANPQAFSILKEVVYGG